MPPDTYIAPPDIPDHFLHYEPPIAEPGLYYRWFVRARWRGPFYFMKSAWLEDLQSVLFLLSSMVRAGAPLPQGLEVAAADAVDDLKYEDKRRFRTVTILGGMILVLCIAFVFAVYDLSRQNDLGPALYAVLFLMFTPSVIAMFLVTKTRKQAILLHLRNKLDSGYQLSEVMQDMNRFFPAMYADLIAQAETSGRMEECIDFMMIRVRDSIESRNRIWQALVYTLFSAFVCFGIVAFLAWKVFPLFQEIINEFYFDGTTPITLVLPWFLQSPDVLLYGLLSLILAGVVAGFTTAILRRRGWNAGVFSILGLCVPWFRKLTLHANLHQIALQLEMLLWAGIPVAQALEKVSASDLNFFYRRALRKVAKRVDNGASLADAFAKHPLLFTRRFVDSLRLGEYSGQVPAMLGEFSHYANSVVSSRSKVFFEMQQPLYILVLAYFVASIMVYTFSLLTAIAEAAVLW